MVNSSGSVASLLSQVYQSDTSSLNNSLQRISTGKRVNSASDDFASYLRANTYNSNVSAYQRANLNLGDGRTYAEQGKAVGNAIMADLVKLQDIGNQYTAAAGDATSQAALSSQYTSLAAAVTSLAATTYGSTNKVMMSTTSYGTFDGIAVTATNALATASLGTAAAHANLDTEVSNVSAFLAQMQSFSDQIKSKIDINTAAISSSKAAISVLTDVDEAEEMNNVTNQQVRLQATAAMMAQANSSSAAIAKLFQ